MNDRKKYIKSSKTTPLSGAIVVHGPEASGKTRFAATASKFFPEKTGEKWVSLPDVCFVTFDQGALDGIHVEKLDVPFIDAREMIADLGAIKGTFEALNALDDYLKEHPEVRFVVPDTVSEMDDLWGEALGKNTEDTRAYYKLLGEMHTRAHAIVNKVCAPRGIVPIYLSHSKARVLASDATEAQKRTQQVEKVGGTMNDIGLDINGSGRNLYSRNASLIFALKCKQLPNREPIYEAYPRGVDGFLGKDRLARVLNNPEPSHLGQILTKIANATKE